MLAAAAGDRLLALADSSAEPTAHDLSAGATCLAADGAALLVGTREGLLAGPPTDLSWALDAHVTSVAVGPDGTRWVGTEPSAVFRSRPGEDGFTPCSDLTTLPSADSWAFPPRPDTHHVRWIAVAPDDPSHLYAAVEAGALVRSSDGGESWRDRVPGGPRDTHSMTTHPDRPRTVWAAAGDGFAVTRDCGDSWTFEEAGLDRTYCWSVAVDPGTPDRLLLSAAPGAYAAHRRPADAAVFRRDSEGSWAPVDLPTDDDATRAVLAAAGPGRCWAADDDGVCLTEDWGETWTRVADVSRESPVAGVAVVGDT
jgi:hypothetical protein